MGYIYKIENSIDKKVYIGQTIRPKYRWQQHLQAAKYKNGPQYNNRLYTAMREYGISNFLFIILEECQEDEMDEKEIYWIDCYKAANPDFGYNFIGGGKGRNQIWRKITQYSIAGEYIATYNNFAEASRATGGDRSWIKEICEGHYALSAGFQWRYEGDESPGAYFKNSMRSVCQYDMEGNLVNTYKNAKVASEETNVGYVSILNCLSKRHASTNGYQFHYADEPSPEKYVDPKLVSVSQYTFDGEYVASYDSVIEAARTMKGGSGTASAISECCKKKLRGSCGYQWRYADDEPPKPYTDVRAYPRQIFQMTIDGEIINSYPSIAEAARKTGIARTNINACCRGKAQTSGGFKWRYA